MTIDLTPTDRDRARAVERARTPQLVRYGYEAEATLMQLAGARIRAIPAGPTTLRAYELAGTLDEWADPAGQIPIAARPTIVVQHGIGARASEFSPILAGLQRMARRVVLVDLPGHGFSDTFPTAHDPDEMFAAWADGMGHFVPEPAIYLGNSLGGGIAIRYARDFPARVTGLILTSPAGAKMSKDQMKRVLGQFRFRTLAEVRGFLARLFARVPWPLYLPLVLDGIRQAFRRPFMMDLMDRLSPKDLFTPDELAAIRIPTLLLWGKEDRILPPEGFDFLREHLGGQPLIAERVPGVAHVPHHEDPAGLNRRIGEWMRVAGLERA